jgi:hypothetical protein
MAQRSGRRESVVKNANKQFLKVALIGIALLLILLAVFGRQLVRFVQDTESAPAPQQKETDPSAKLNAHGFDPAAMEMVPPRERAMQVAFERETMGDFLMEDNMPKEAAVAYNGAAKAAEKLVEEGKAAADEAERAKKHIARFHYKESVAHIGSKDFQDAFQALEYAAGSGYNYQEITDDPRLRPLRIIDDERFNEVVSQARTVQEEILREQAQRANAEARRAWRRANE